MFGALDDAPKSQIARRALEVRRGREHAQLQQTNSDVYLMLKVIRFMEAYAAQAKLIPGFDDFVKGPELSAAQGNPPMGDEKHLMTSQEWTEVRDSMRPMIELLENDDCPFPAAERQKLRDLYRDFNEGYERHTKGKGGRAL